MQSAMYVLIHLLTLYFIDSFKGNTQKPNVAPKMQLSPFARTRHNSATTLISFMIDSTHSVLTSPIHRPARDLGTVGSAYRASLGLGVLRRPALLLLYEKASPVQHIQSLLNSQSLLPNCTCSFLEYLSFNMFIS